jgi:hypothetical protein
VTEPFDPRRLGAGNQASVLQQIGHVQPQADPEAVPGETGGVPDAELDYRARRDAQRLGQAELEGDYSKVGTAVTQFGRGVLDVVLAPGALIGAGIEGVGELADSEGMRDFGRGLGTASSGDELMATLNPSTLRAVFGGEGEEALSEYDAMKGAIRDQEEAWPMLASTSRLAGSVAGGVGIGGLASGGAKLATTAGVAAYEGAGYGAQSAYASNASLRDVMTSTLVGAAVGGAMPLGMHYGGKYAGKVAKEGLESFAERRAVKAITGNYKAAFKDLSRHGTDPERVQHIGRKLLDRGVNLDDLDDSIVGVIAEKNAAAGTLQGVAKGLDDSGVRVDTRKVLAGADEQIAELRKIGLGTFDAVADKLEGELAGFRRVADGPVGVIRGRGGPAVTGRDMSFSEFWKFRQNFDDIVNFEKIARSPAEKSMRQLRGTIDDALDAALPAKQRKAWLAAKEDYGDFVTLEKHGQALKQARETNRFFSPSDQGWGGTAMLLSVLGGDVSGLSGMAIGAAATGAHKFLRETGSGRIARMADRISKSLTHHADEAVDASPLQRLFGQVDDDARHVVSVEAAGGREAQGVIADLYNARKAAQAAAEKAGANPAARHAAIREASEEVRTKLAKKTGQFNPAEWSSKAPTPLQKVFHRSQILDQVADDTVAAVSKASNLRPRIDFDLDARKLTKLLKNADGPAAIGGLQQRLRAIAAEAPKTAEGDVLRAGLAKAAHGLEKTDLPGTMAEGHRLVKQLLIAAEAAPDDLTKGWAQRQARAVMNDLGSERFGQAGAMYREAVAEGSERFAALGDRTILRETLRTADMRGKLGSVVREQSELVARAADAQHKLAGVAKPKELVGELRKLEALVSQAEEAVTLDGGPIGRVFDFFKNKMEDRVAAAAGGADDVGAIVSKFVRPKLEKVAKHAKGHHKHGLKEKVVHTAHHAAEHTATHTAEHKAISPVLKPYQAKRAASNVAARLLTRGEQQAQYAERMNILQQATSGGDTDAAEEGVAAIDAIAPGLGPLASAGMTEKLGTLLTDLPKPPPTHRGAPEDGLSSNDLRVANAMWEATMEPLSVFDDFDAGDVDYDKVKYAWKQYPGLHQAAQMGLMDIMHEQMDDEERAAMPDSLVTQLDNLFGMEGALAPTVSYDFAQRISQAGQAEQEQKRPPPSGGTQLKLPGAQASFTQRLSGQQR